MRFLVTAGNTHEMIDSVRQWSNIFTGGTGLSIARAIAQIGQVDLLSSNRAHLDQIASQQTTRFPINAIGFTSHAELRNLLAAKIRQQNYDAVFMSAAVSDYRPLRVYEVLNRQDKPTVNAPADENLQQWIVRDVQADKVKSNHALIAVLGEPTEKLVDLFRREWNYRGVLVKFKLEVGISRQELIRIGQASRVASGAEYLVANTLDMVQGQDAGAYLLSEQGSEWIPRPQLPARMTRLVQEHFR